MTEPIQPTPGVIDTEQPEDVAEPDDTDEALDMRAVKRLRNENKKLRHQLREAQENYGGAAARLAAAERREIEREASSMLVDRQTSGVTPTRRRSRLHRQRVRRDRRHQRCRGGEGIGPPATTLGETATGRTADKSADREPSQRGHARREAETDQLGFRTARNWDLDWPCCP